MTFSLVVPIYRNEENIFELIERLEQLHRSLKGSFEAIIVVDGSPDKSEALLSELLPKTALTWQLISLSRNFGSFSAIRAGLSAGRGEYFGVMAADLQEPLELVVELYEKLLTGESDIVIATRETRQDPIFSRALSSLFWSGYRKIVLPAMPKGGVDIFACTRTFRDNLLSLDERRSTLVGLLFWLGFRMTQVPYHRVARKHGRSAWTVFRKIRYFLDSVFALSTLPVHLLEILGLTGMLFSVVAALFVIVAKFAGAIVVPGYAATVLTVMFFGGLNSLGLGIIGEYVYRALENSRRRPEYIIASRTESNTIGIAKDKEA